MSKILQVQEGLLFTRRDERVLISPYGENVLRVRATRNTTFSEDNLYYQEDGYVGFADYSVVGEEYSETGFARV